MVVLSLFNGMSCGYVALQEAGISVTKYYSSEVDKHAVNMSSILYPETIQLGDVRNIDVSKLDKIDILIGGSPCQSFSFAGKMKGMATKCEKEILSLEQYLELKEQNFEFEGQSYLFWEYVRIYTELRKINSDIKFLLENVLMVEKWERIISKTLEVNPIMINSALVSAQNRKRLYWTNIGMQPAGLFGEMASIIKQPEDKGILLKDILEENVPEKYYLSDKMLEWLGKREKEATDINGKSACFTAGGHSGGLHSQMDLICVAMRGRNPENPKTRKAGLPTEQMIEPRNDGKTNCLTSVQKDNYVVCHNSMPRSSKTGKGGTGPLSREDGKTYCLDTGQTNVIEILEKSPCLHGFEHGTNGQLNKQLVRGGMIRRLTPRECGRLQTVPEHLLDKMLSSGISYTQLYKMFGNGWTVSVIAHIFSYLIPYQKDKIIAE